MPSNNSDTKLRRLLLNLESQNRTKRGMKRDHLLKSKRVLDPSKKADLKRIMKKNRKKNIFQLYDVVGIDFDAKSKSVKKYKPRKANALKMLTNLGKRTSLKPKTKTTERKQKYNYPKAWLKKDGTILYNKKKAAAKFRKEHKPVR